MPAMLYSHRSLDNMSNVLISVKIISAAGNLAIEGNTQRGLCCLYVWVNLTLVKPKPAS